MSSMRKVLLRSTPTSPNIVIVSTGSYEMAAADGCMCCWVLVFLQGQAGHGLLAPRWLQPCLLVKHTAFLYTRVVVNT